jgi:hypothetical protein
MRDDKGNPLTLLLEGDWAEFKIKATMIDERIIF